MRMLLATALRGLRSRGLLTAGALLLTVIAVASAVLGPIYQVGATRSFLVEKLRSEPPLLTALTFDYAPEDRVTIDAAVVDAVDQAARAAGPGFAAPHPFVFSQPSLADNVGPDGGEPRLVSVPGACQHVRLTGRCPTNLDEIAILAADSKQLGLKIGDTFHPWADSRTVTVVATYQPRAADAAFWLLDTRLQSSPAVPATPVTPGHPYRPGPWLTPQSTLDRGLVPWQVVTDVTVDTPPDLEAEQVAALARHTATLIHDQGQQVPLPGTVALEPGNALPTIAADLLARRTVARDTVTPAVVSLVLVALVLLSRLLSASMQLRRAELALASLRGWSRRRLWVLGLVEPLLVVAVSTPVGLALGYVAARVLARSWLVPGLPVPLALGSLAGAALVVVATAAVAVLVVRDALSEPLSAQIGGVRRPSRAGRGALILQLLLIAAAVVVTFAAATRGHTGAPDATDLLLPILLAVAAGIASGAAALVVAELWVRFTRQRRGLASYVGARTVRRRREGTLVIFPLTAAMAIAVFAAGVSGAAAAWRGSTAATEVGAARSYSTTLTLGQAVDLTRAVDPRGRWLMALAEDSLPQVDQARIIADTSRLARVADWPASWTPGLSPRALAGRLGPTGRSIQLRGSRVGMTLDNRVRGEFPQLGVELDYLDDRGNTTSTSVGPFTRGRSSHENPIPGCHDGCTLLRLVFGGPDALVESMQGTAVISSFTIDGRPVPQALERAWRPIESPIGTRSAVRGTPAVSGGTLSIDFRARTSDSYGGITTDETPLRVPVLWGRGARQTPTLANGASKSFPVRSVATAESMPLLGPSGVLIDWDVFARHGSFNLSTDDVRILARADTPATVLRALGDRGLVHPDTEVAARSLLDHDAFALALRLYTIVVLLVILLALAGLGANLAVQMPARRRDAASLRVVGVSKRSVLGSVVAEFGLVLGAAALAGLAAGALAQSVVVNTVTLGFSDSPRVPRTLPVLDGTAILTLALVLSVVLLAIAVLVGAMTVRSARTASLRENAR